MNKRGQEYVITMIVVLALMTLILGLYMGWIDTSIPVINSLIGKENLDLRVQECNNACNSIPPQSYAYCQKTRKLTLPDKKKTEGTCYEFSRGENIPAEYKSYFQSCEKINCEEFLGGVEAEGEVDAVPSDTGSGNRVEAPAQSNPIIPQTSSVGVNSFITNIKKPFQIYKSGSTSEIISSSAVNYGCYKIFDEGTGVNNKKRYLIGIIDSRTVNRVDTGWIPADTLSTYWEIYQGDRNNCGW